MNLSGFTYAFTAIGGTIIGAVLLVKIGASQPEIYACGLGLALICLGVANRK